MIGFSSISLAGFCAFLTDARTLVPVDISDVERSCHFSSCRALYEYQWSYHASFQRLTVHSPGITHTSTDSQSWSHGINMGEKTKVIVVGAGIVGPILAIFLKMKGYEPVIYERTDQLSDAGLSMVYV